MLLGCKGYRIKSCHIEWLRHSKMMVELKRAAGGKETEEEEIHS